MCIYIYIYIYTVPTVNKESKKAKQVKHSLDDDFILNFHAFYTAVIWKNEVKGNTASGKIVDFFLRYPLSY